MAGVATTARLSARLANRYASRNVMRRGFQCSAPDRAAQNYTMPALSPTMTEGNIAAWRIKEGDSFAAGDVLLEIETDKATMDVEAQDDGVLVKIFEGDGAKAIAVGRRIAVTADAGDDVASVEIPAEEKSNSAAAGKGKETGAGEGKSGEVEQSPPKEETVETKGRGEKNAASQGSDAASGTSKASHAQPQKQKFQLSVAVETLLHQNGLSAADADNITATGPRGRLLKGDVLAHLGQISKEAPAKVQKHVEKQTHLDLSNIQLAKTSVEKPQQTPAPQSEAAAAAKPEQTVTELAIPISLSAVLATQKRVQDSLGIFLPLSTFIQRASELANDGLPASKTAKPTADDLFNAVLGLDKVPRASRGSFFPHISGVTPPARFGAPAAKSAKKQDIFDLLTAPKKKNNSAAPRSPAGALGIAPNAPNMFSVVAQSGEEKRAEEYLERMKIVLEQEPGRLVL